MTLTADKLVSFARGVLGDDPNVPKLPMEKYLEAIPRLQLAGRSAQRHAGAHPRRRRRQARPEGRRRRHPPPLDEGHPRFLPGSTAGSSSSSGTSAASRRSRLSKVRTRLAEILGCEVGFIADWLDPETTTIQVTRSPGRSRRAAPGSVIMLENTRKYDIERVLWKAKPADLPKLADKLAKLANEFAAKVAKVYIHEAFSAGSLDASSVIVPAAMDRVALGEYEGEQFHVQLRDCLAAQLVIFSGLKADKLDDMEAMIARGKIRMVISAGSLSASLKKAAAELEGKDFNLGVAEDPAHADKPYFIPRNRIEQAKKMLVDGRAKGIEFILPVDFVLQDGQVSSEIGPGNQQFDVGPASSKLFADTVTRFIEAHKNDKPPAVAFHNGVFGMFEDPRFERGTKEFVPQLKRMKDAGIKVYIGGGEGGTSLEKYGQPDWVTYVFTAGGTVLNALGSEPVPYLVALMLAAKK